MSLHYDIVDFALLDCAKWPEPNVRQLRPDDEIFDVLVLAGRDVMREPLHTRRALLETHVLPKLNEPIWYSQELQASLSDLIAAVRAQGFEGLVAKDLTSRYEPGKRSGAWQKMRVNRTQDSRALMLSCDVTKRENNYGNVISATVPSGPAHCRFRNASTRSDRKVGISTARAPHRRTRCSPDASPSSAVCTSDTAQHRGLELPRFQSSLERTCIAAR